MGLIKSLVVDVLQAPEHVLRMLTQADINQMTIPERMDAIDKLWTSIIESGQEIPSPEWHKEVLEERTAHVESGTAKFYTLDEVRKKLRMRRK